MDCPYCESENWTRDGFSMAEEWMSDEYVRHYIKCECKDCKRRFYERVEYTYRCHHSLSVDQFEARLNDGIKKGHAVWTTDGMEVE